MAAFPCRLQDRQADRQGVAPPAPIMHGRGLALDCGDHFIEDVAVAGHALSGRQRHFLHAVVGVKQHTIGRRPGIGLFAGRDQYAKVRLVGPVRRLDGLFDQMLNDVGARSVFLKMDTQGWDLEVLRGANACISRIGAVQSEIPLKTIYKGMPSFMEVITECNRLGLDITGMFPVSRDTNNLAIVEFDCVMARRRPNTVGALVGVPRATDPLY